MDLWITLALRVGCYILAPLIRPAGTFSPCLGRREQQENTYEDRLKKFLDKGVLIEGSVYNLFLIKNELTDPKVLGIDLARMFFKYMVQMKKGKVYYKKD